MIIRNASNKDKEELKAIWKKRFGDDDCFIEWFFKDRFFPEHSRVIEADNKIVSCLYSMPMSVSVLYGPEKAVLISGVSTLPDYEKRGLMRKAMSHHLKDMRDKGYNISVLKAVRPDIYYSLEHRLISDIIVASSFRFTNTSSCVKNVDISKCYHKLHSCYKKYAYKYSGMVLRQYDDFVTRCHEYEFSETDCIAYFNENEIEAYCFCYHKQNTLVCEEFVSITDNGYIQLLSYIENNISYESMEVKLPCDFPDELLETYIFSHGNSAYIINVSEVLKKTGLNGFAIEIIDSVIEENNGIFSLSGKKVNDVPSLHISNGYLTQWFFGYKTMAKIIDEGHAKCFDENIIECMDCLKINPCYCLDEY